MADTPESWATGRLLSHVARRLERRWNAHLERWGLNHANLPVLLHLLRGDHSQRELAEASTVTEQTMSRTIGRLERLGYVQRAADAQDARRRVVRLTPRGREVVLAAGRPEAGEAMVARGLTPEQVEQLRALLLLMVDPDDEIA